MRSRIRRSRQRLEHQAEVALLEVAEPAVDQAARAASWCPRRSPRCSTSTVRRPRRAASRAIAGAGDAAADDQQVRRLAPSAPERGAPENDSRCLRHPVPRLPRPSSWFAWHAHRIRAGSRVLDLACGDGPPCARRRRARRQGRRRSTGTPTQLDVGREARRAAGAEVDWLAGRPRGAWPDLRRLRCRAGVQLSRPGPDARIS